jgi:4-hydroxy-tetrahydrodipicolinate synthase
MTIDRSDRKAWAREHFRGLENCIMPSFRQDLRELDEEGVRLDVRQSISHGFFSSLCALETGLTTDEKKQMLSIATDEAGDKLGIALSLTGETIDENIDILRHAESVGATHALVSYPQAFRPKTQDEVYAFVRALADSTNIGLYLFVSDKFSFHHLHPSGVPFEAYEKLADVDNIVAIKLGGMDSGMIYECCERFNDRLLVTTVNIGLLPMLRKMYGLQWSGAWTVEALQSPGHPYAVDFMNLLLADRIDDAMAIYWRLAPALGSMMRVMAPLVPTGTYHWPMLKFYQWLSGGNGGMTRQPCMRLFERDMMAIRGGLRAVGIDCKDPNEDFYAGRAELARQRKPG